MGREQLNIRLAGDWAGRLDELVAEAAAALGLPNLSKADVVLMGLSLVAAWVKRVAQARDGLEPEPPKKRRGEGGA